MIAIGLTGSIGMGKSTTAAMFAAEGIPVHDSDATVHALYSGRAAPLIEAAFPGTTQNGVVDRTKLAAVVLGDGDALKRLEAIVHPLVREEEERFRSENAAAGADMILLDIPLLFEAGRDKAVDAIVVVSADAVIQRERVLSRPGMSEEKFAAIQARQLPDAEKRERADYVVDTGKGMDDAREQVRAIIADMRAKRITQPGKA
ncbi:MAG: dephospho-CoA kinase [Brucellaceae bacterium]|nr:dephospho-CoA kinase [Brucellaceae bacterium]